MSDQPTPAGFSSLNDLMNSAAAGKPVQEVAEVTTQGQIEPTVEVKPEMENPTVTDDIYKQHIEEHYVPQVQPPKAEVAQSAIAQQVKRDPETIKPLTPNETESFDLNNLNILDINAVSSADIMAAINTAVNKDNSGTFRAVALKSGYAFEVEPLRFAEIERLINTVGDTHSEQVKLVKTVFGKIKWFSCGHLSYSDFINCTAYDDFDTILYAVYRATYPGINKYPITCQGCGEENTIEVSSDRLISKIDNDKLVRVKSVLQSASEAQRQIDMLPLEMRTKLKLRESGIIVEYGVSSIADFLAGIARIQNGMVDSKTGKVDTSKSELTSMVDFELAIDYMYIPAPNAPGQYLKLADKAQINSILSKLSRVDGPEFKDNLRKIRDQYRVDYTIPKFNCASCGKESPELALNFEQLLFTEMNREKEA